MRGSIGPRYRPEPGLRSSMTTHCPPPASGAAAMPSNDVRTLLQAAVPTAVAGAVAAAISGGVAGGKGALGAVVATIVVILFMGIGLMVLQRTARSLPHLFQAMGLMLYTAQLLLLFIFVAAFKNTTLFNPKAFAITLVATTRVDRRTGACAHEGQDPLRRARVPPGRQAQEHGLADVKGRGGISARSGPCYRPVPTAALRARACELTPARSRGSMPDCRSHIRNTSPVPNRGSAPRRHNEVAVPMRHAEGARGEC